MRHLRSAEGLTFCKTQTWALGPTSDAILQHATAMLRSSGGCWLQQQSEVLYLQQLTRCCTIAGKEKTWPQGVICGATGGPSAMGHVTCPVVCMSTCCKNAIRCQTAQTEKDGEKAWSMLSIADQGVDLTQHCVCQMATAMHQPAGCRPNRAAGRHWQTRPPRLRHPTPRRKSWPPGICCGRTGRGAGQCAAADRPPQPPAHPVNYRIDISWRRCDMII